MEAIRSLAPDSPMVVLTGMEQGGLAIDAMKAGVQDYLYKGDVQPETLRRSVLYAMERKRAQLAHEALHDPLTGAAEPGVVPRSVPAGASGIGRMTSGVGVLFIDLDNFKKVNDSLGHTAGDKLLVQAAERLRQALRAGDTVSRFGGDEFTVLGATLDNRHDASSWRSASPRRSACPSRSPGATWSLTCSIGIAFTFERSDPDVLIHEADLAMYRAKERGGACYEVFGQSLRARTTSGGRWSPSCAQLSTRTSSGSRTSRRSSSRPAG